MYLTFDPSNFNGSRKSGIVKLSRGPYIPFVLLNPSVAYPRLSIFVVFEEDFLYSFLDDLPTDAGEDSTVDKLFFLGFFVGMGKVSLTQVTTESWGIFHSDRLFSTG